MRKKYRIIKFILDMLLIFVGAVIAAFAIEEFLVPCTILDGGVVGVSIMISTLTKAPLGIVSLAINIPFLIIGSRKLGKQFVIKSGFAMAVFSVAVSVFEKLHNVTEEYLLAVCFGGVILGFGVGLVIKFGGCLDGTEAVAILINKKTKMPVGRTVLIINVVVYGVAGILFGFDRAMYSLLTYFITSKILDIIESGTEKVKAALIITEEAEAIANDIYKKLGRTVTIMEGQGLVSGKKVVMYCVLTRFEVNELRSIIDNADMSAFVTITDVSEIIGNHIKRVDAAKINADRNANNIE